MSFLEVPGARLHYEIDGNGPLLIMIHGANGSGDVYKGVVQHLSDNYNVLTYDRRGFSRSQLKDSPDYTHKLETDANDARLLIEQFTDKPAIVFGSSSGAIVALELLVKYPTVVSKIYLHEPPLMEVLSEGEKWMAFFSEIYDDFHQFGMEHALRRFRKEMLAESDLQAAAHATRNVYAISNFTYWVEHELIQYTSANISLDLIKGKTDRLVTLAGLDSRGYPAYEVSLELARKLGTDLIELPGGHNGYMTLSYEFARKLDEVLLSTEGS